MKMNNKGYASTIIMFSVLTLFLVSMLVLVKTMNNSSSLNKSIKSNVINDINYGDYTSLKEQVEQLQQQVQALTNYKEKQVDPIISALNASDYTPVKEVNNSTKVTLGGYKKVGKMVFVNIVLTDSQNFATTTTDDEGKLVPAYLSENTNKPTLILSGLPKPLLSKDVNATSLTAITYYCVATGGPCGPSYMFSVLRNDGSIYLSQNLEHKYSNGFGIRIFGTYITTDAE